MCLLLSTSIYLPVTVDYICTALLLPTEQPPFPCFCNSRVLGLQFMCPRMGLFDAADGTQDLMMPVLYQLTYILSPRNRKSPDFTKGNLFFPTKPLLKTVIKCTFRKF